MNHSLGLAIESLVAVLLMLTIGYCWLLNKRLTRLKADEQSLKATIGELITATEIAERAIGGLKHTVRDVDQNLSNQITLATDLSQRLASLLSEGEGLQRRLSRIVGAGKPLTELVEPTVSSAKLVAAAADAFAQRRRGAGLAA